MEIDFAILAERAETGSKGLLQLFGGGLNQITAAAFPALAQLAIAVRFVGQPTEAGTTHSLSLAITSPRGERSVIPETRDIQLPASDSEDRYNRPGALVVFELIIAFVSAGPYAFHLGIDGADAKELRLLVKQGEIMPALAGRLAVSETLK